MTQVKTHPDRVESNQSTAAVSRGKLGDIDTGDRNVETIPESFDGSGADPVSPSSREHLENGSAGEYNLDGEDHRLASESIRGPGTERRTDPCEEDFDSCQGQPRSLRGEIRDSLPNRDTWFGFSTIAPLAPVGKPN